MNKTTTCFFADELSCQSWGGSEIIPYNSLFYCKVNLVCLLQSLSQGEGVWVCSAIIGPGLLNRKTGFYYSQPVGIVGSWSIIFATQSEGAALLIKPVRRGFPPGICRSADPFPDFVTKGGKKHLNVFNVYLEHVGAHQQPLHTLYGVAVGRRRL